MITDSFRNDLIYFENRLKNKESFSLTRFGDGERDIMDGKHLFLSRSKKEFDFSGEEDLQQDLIKSFKLIKKIFIKINDEIIKAAKIDGAGIFSIYSKIILPMMRPVFMSAIVILVHLSIKSYDLIIALTSGGPGISSDMPAVFMTAMAFHRSEVGLASASAIMMFLTVSAIVVPYLYSELKRENAR